MSTLLQIDSSSSQTGASISRQLTAEFVEQWKKSHPGGTVITRDLMTSALPPVTSEWIGASYTPESARTQDQRQVLAISDALVQELQDADEYVIGVPMYNFSIPAVLKLWIDQIVRAGKTFSYEGGAPNGLLKGKKATILVASGGVYDHGTPMEAMNFVEPYLRSILAFLGVTEANFINAGGTARLSNGASRDVILAPAVQSIRAQFASAPRV